MAYNLTNLSSDNSILGLMQFANEITSGWFGMLVLLGVFVIAFVVMGGTQLDDKKQPFAAATFITFILMLILRVSEVMVNDTVFIFNLILLGVSVVMLFRGNN